MSTLTYHGLWQAGRTYGPGALVTRSGATFLYTANAPYKGSVAPAEDSDHWSALAAAETRQDTFVRANQEGWGTASDGHLWTAEGTTESGTAFISSNVGYTTANADSSVDPILYCGDAFTHPDAEVSATFGVFAVGQGQCYLFLRALPGLDTQARVGFDVYGQAIELRIYDHGFGDFEGSYYGDWSAGAPDTLFRARFRAEGQRYRAKVWPDGDTEPSSWQLDYTATTVLGAGSVGFQPGTLSTGQVHVLGFSARSL